METGNWVDIGLVISILFIPVIAIFIGWAAREIAKKMGISVDNGTINLIIKRAYSLAEKLHDHLKNKSESLPRDEKIKLIFDKLVDYGKILDVDVKARRKLLVIAETAVDQQWKDEDGNGIPDILEEEDLEKLLNE